MTANPPVARAIEIFAGPCACSRRFQDAVQRAAEKVGATGETRISLDLERCVELGIFSLPALVVDGRVVAVRRLPDSEALEKLLRHGVSPD